MSTISVPELHDLLADPATTIVDVRSAAEYEAAHIPGSVRIGLDELRVDPHQAATVIPAHAVIVCRSGARAEQACRTIAEAGRDDLRVLEGGLLAWEGAGETVERGPEHWDLERQVRLVAGSLVLAGVLASLAYRPAVLLSGGVGAGLTFAALSNTCAMGSLLARLPYNRRSVDETPLITDRFAQLARRRETAA